MNFLYPQVLWGLFILIIPILIHLFNFKRYKTIYFSSLRFIRKIDEESKSTQRLKRILILISRMLLLFFLVLAFAQPYLNDESESTTPEGGILSIYIDNSFSMQALGPEGELLSQAREKAREIIRKADPGSRFLLLSNDMTGREEIPLSKADALSRLDEIDYSPHVRSIAEIIAWQKDILQNKLNLSLKSTNINSLLFSDFQKSCNKETNRDSSNIKHFPIQLIPEVRSNLFIDSVWFSSPVHKQGAADELSFRVCNLDKEERTNAEVFIKIGDQNKTIYLDIPAESKKTQSFNIVHRSAGLQSGEIRVSDKQVHFDDSYYFTFEVKKHLPILILNGENAVDNISKVFQLDSYYQVHEKPLSNLLKQDFIKKNLVVINGANALSNGVQDYLKDFVTKGGNLALFPGENPNIGQWAALMRELNLGALSSRTLENPGSIQLNIQDPFFKAVFERETQGANYPKLNRVFASNPSPKARVLLSVNRGNPVFLASKNPGNTYIYLSPLQPEFGNMTDNALFSTILLRMGEEAQQTESMSYQIGTNSSVNLNTSVNEQLPIRLVGEGIQVIPPFTNLNGNTYLQLNRIDNQGHFKPGHYSIEQDKQLGKLSLNYNRMESDITQLSQAETIALFSDKNKVKYSELSSQRTISFEDIDQSQKFWKICLLISFIFVFIEMLLIRFIK